MNKLRFNLLLAAGLCSAGSTLFSAGYYHGGPGGRYQQQQSPDKLATDLIDAIVEGINDNIYYYLGNFGNIANLKSRRYHNETPLMAAVRYNNPYLVEQMLSQYGADLNIRNDQGQTALDLAHAARNPGVIQAITAFSSRFIQPVAQPEQAQSQSSTSGSRLRANVAEFRPSAPSATTQAASTAPASGTGLSAAVEPSALALVAGPRVPGDTDVDRVLDAWITRGNRRASEVLSQDMIARSGTSNNDKLFIAAMLGDTKGVKDAIAAGADVNYKAIESDEKFGLGKRHILNSKFRTSLTPLMAAAMNGYDDIVRFLVTNGATLDLTNEYCDTAFSLAMKRFDMGLLAADVYLISLQTVISYLGGELMSRGLPLEIIGDGHYRFEPGKEPASLTVLNREVSGQLKTRAKGSMQCNNGRLSRTISADNIVGGTLYNVRIERPRQPLRIAEAPSESRELVSLATAATGIAGTSLARAERMPMVAEEVPVEELNQEAFGLIGQLSEDLTVDVASIGRRLLDLIRSGADVNARNAGGNTMLMDFIIKASQFKDLATLPLLRSLLDKLIERAAKDAAMQKNIDGKNLIDLLVTTKLPPSINPVTERMIYKELADGTKGWFKPGKGGARFDTNRLLIEKVLEKFDMRLGENKKKKIDKLAKTNDSATARYHEQE